MEVRLWVHQTFYGSGLLNLWEYIKGVCVGGLRIEGCASLVSRESLFVCLFVALVVPLCCAGSCCTKILRGGVCHAGSANRWWTRLKVQFNLFCCRCPCEWSLFLKMQYVQSVFGILYVYTGRRRVVTHTAAFRGLGTAGFPDVSQTGFYLLFVDDTLIWITLNQRPFSERVNVVRLHGCLLVCWLPLSVCIGGF